MKKIIAVVVVIIVAGLAFSYIKNKEKEKNTLIYPEGLTNKTIENSISGRNCYSYHHQGTKEEPYTVDEKIDITVNSGIVTGTKKGTQNGPDMTNGYQGSLAGAAEGANLKVDYSYTIEGSKNIEKEEYLITREGLTKQGWPLKEENGVLVPDKTKPLVKEMKYSKTDCSIL